MHLSTRHLAIAATLSSASSAIAASDALSPLTSALSGSPIGSLQTGLSQFSNLVSPSIFAKLQSRMQTLPTRSSTPLTVPVQKAFAATSLAADNADKAALADAQSCLSDILARGSIPEGYACVDPNGNTVSAYTTACDTVLEQFVGIVPPSTMTVLQKQFNSYFASLGLIPPVNDLNTHLQNVIASVTASNSGEAVTGTERLQACLESALNGSTGLQQNYQCFMGKDSTWTSLNTLFAGIVQQFGGYLPPNVMQDVINIYMYYLSAANVPGLDMMKPMNNAMMSMTAAVAGNSVTAIEQMQQCFNDLLMTPDADARANYVCLMGSTGPIMTIEVLINGIVRPFVVRSPRPSQAASLMRRPSLHPPLARFADPAIVRLPPAHPRSPARARPPPLPQHVGPLLERGRARDAGDLRRERRRARVRHVLRGARGLRQRGGPEREQRDVHTAGQVQGARRAAVRTRGRRDRGSGGAGGRGVNWTRGREGTGARKGGTDGTVRGRRTIDTPTRASVTACFFLDLG